MTSGSRTINTIAVNIAQSARGEDLEAVDNKVEAANRFTASIDTPEEIAALQDVFDLSKIISNLKR